MEKIKENIKIMKKLKIVVGILLILNILPVISIFIHHAIGSEFSTVKSYLIGWLFNIGSIIIMAFANLISWLFRDL